MNEKTGSIKSKFRTVTEAFSRESYEVPMAANFILSAANYYLLPDNHITGNGGRQTPSSLERIADKNTAVPTSLHL